MSETTPEDPNVVPLEEGTPIEDPEAQPADAPPAEPAQPETSPDVVVIDDPGDAPDNASTVLDEE